MLCQGYYLVGLSESLQGWKACCLFVSFSFSLHSQSLTRSVFYSQSVGMTPNGEDFEKFIGHEKAEEFKALFSSWIHKIYRSSIFCYILFEPHLTSPVATSDWHLYSLKRSATSTDDVSPMASSSQQVNGEEGSSSAGSEGVNPDTDAQKLDLAPASVTSPTPLVTGADHLQPTTLPGANPAAIAPSDSRPNSSYPASPTGVSTTIVQGQDILDPSPPDSPDHHTPPNDVTDHHAPPNDVNPPATLDGLPMNARQSEWMISKKTLKYFCEVNEAGKLSNLILHWYQLEQALGFQEIVRHLTTRTMMRFTNGLQTAKEFPTQKRPVVLRVFFKHGHKYKRDYELEAGSFGAEIMNWWEEIKSADVCFGGPTGMYTLVVLMTWWCSLLKGHPNDKLSDYFRTLDDIDRTILSAIRNMASQPSPAIPASTISPTPPPRGTKRTISDEPSSRKRLRTKRAGRIGKD